MQGLLGRAGHIDQNLVVWLNSVNLAWAHLAEKVRRQCRKDQECRGESQSAGGTQGVDILDLGGSLHEYQHSYLESKGL